MGFVLKQAITNLSIQTQDVKYSRNITFGTVGNTVLLRHLVILLTVYEIFFIIKKLLEGTHTLMVSVSRI